MAVGAEKIIEGAIIQDIGTILAGAVVMYLGSCFYRRRKIFTRLEEQDRNSNGIEEKLKE